MRHRPRVRALRTVTARLDGQLDDWTDDIKDRNVSPYRHAEPAVLGADTLVQGRIEGDQELSGIVYFLWNDVGLYVGGLTVNADRITVQIGQRPLPCKSKTSKASSASPPQRTSKPARWCLQIDQRKLARMAKPGAGMKREAFGRVVQPAGLWYVPRNCHLCYSISWSLPSVLAANARE